MGADDGLGALVLVEDAVPALRLVRRIADEMGGAEAEAMVGAAGAALASPGPEIGARDRSPARRARGDRLVDEPVESVLEARRAAGIEQPAVAREAELLDHQRLAELPREADMLREIIAHLRRPRIPGAGQVVRIHPAPVERPDVGGEIVDLGRRMLGEDAGRILDAALQSLASGRDQVV